MRFRGVRPCRDRRTAATRSFPARAASRVRVNESRQFCGVDEDDESFKNSRSQKAQNIIQRHVSKISDPILWFFFVPLVANLTLPTVIRGMAGLHGYEGAATRGANSVVRD